MRCEKTFAFIFRLIFLTGIFVFVQQNQSAQSISTVKYEPFEFNLKTRTFYQMPQVTENIAYEQMFRLILSFEKQAQNKRTKDNCKEPISCETIFSKKPVSARKKQVN